LGVTVAGRGFTPKPSDRQRRNAPKALASVTALVPDVSCPPPPAGLLKATRGQWAAFWGSPVAKLVDADSDLPALSRLFELVDDCTRYRTSIRQSPFVEGSQGQQVRNPYVRDLQAAQAELRQLEDRFGLSPRARLSLGVVLGEAKRSLADLGAAFNSDGGRAMTATTLGTTTTRGSREDDVMDEHLVKPETVAAGLRRVLAALDAGEVDVTPSERAYLAGALDVLEQMSNPPPLQ